MAYYFIFPEKDATLYSHPDRSTMNTGQDEILEIVKEKISSETKFYPSRILIQFSDNNIQKALNVTQGNTYSTNLQLFSTEHENLAINQIIELYPLSKKWEEGTGRYPNTPISTNGCSWLYKDGLARANEWNTGSFDTGTTGSISPSSGITPGGGEWYTGSGFFSSQSFSNADILDLNLDITSIITKFSASYSNKSYPTAIPNYGFILKYPQTSEEFSSGSYGDLKYFSVDTHTIYPPKLAFKWDDSTIDISTVNGEIFRSTAILPNESLNVSLYNSKKEYNINEVVTFRLHIREKYPTRQFTTSSNYLEPGYFKTTSYYSIRDAHTEEIIIPFDDNYTKLSADSDGMFFRLYMNGLQPERYYRILLKSTNDFGTTIFDDNYHFKVVR
tara:strand:+ start:1724 stop:2887 length:1164 start_codon:yes stop_codon:yes gene_type:complete